MYLQQHFAPEIASLHFLIQIYHCDLNDVGRAALHRSIYGHALRSLLDHSVSGTDFGQEPSPPQYRLHVTDLSSSLLGSFQIFLHFGIFLEIQGDELRSFFSAELGGLLQAVVTHAIDDSEIDRLGIPAHLRAYFINRDPEQLGSGRGMDILVLGKGSDKAEVFREVRQNPEVDLGVVGTQKVCPGRSYNGFPYLVPQIAPYRYILQVGVAGGETAGSSASLIESGVYPPRLTVNKGGPLRASITDASVE
jgi:hypothetical protein